MTITQLHDNKPLPERLPCAICGKDIELTQATAGLADDAHVLRFACNGHSWNAHQFIVGWANLLASERAKRIQSQFLLEYGEATNARALC